MDLTWMSLFQEYFCCAFVKLNLTLTYFNSCLNIPQQMVEASKTNGNQIQVDLAVCCCHEI